MERSDPSSLVHRHEGRKIMHILIVDDREENRYLLEALLRGNGHDTTAAANGVEALERLKSGGFELIISDILMPVMDGFQLCKKVKTDQALRHIPFIVYTATYTGSQDEAFAMKIGADRFIQKPCEPDAFMKAVREVSEAANRRDIASIQAPMPEEEMLKLYSERLVRKLEKKALEMEKEVQARREAEETLRASERKYRLLADNTLDIIWAMDLDLAFTYVNPAIQSRMGYLPEEFVGSLLSEHCDEENFARVAQIIADEMAKGPNDSGVVLEAVLLNKNRDPVPFEIHGKVIYDENGEPTGLQGIARDISERKRAEEALEQSERTLRTIFEGTVDGILATETETKRFVLANEGICRMLGYDRNELLSLCVKDIHPENDLPQIEDQLEQQLRGEISLADNIPVKRKNGSVFYADVNATPIKLDGRPCLLGSFRDITERKRAEEREKHLNTVLRALRSVNQLITKEKNREYLIQEVCAILTSTRGFKSAWIALVNETGAFLKVAGSGLSQDYRLLMEDMKRSQWPQCARDAFAGSGVVVIEGDASACVDCPLADDSKDHGAFATRLEQNGKVYGLMVVSIPRDLVSDKDEQGLFWEVARDVAFALNSMEQEEKRAEAESERTILQEQFRQSQKLEAIGRLAGGIAHDFNNLLTTIMGNAEMALMDFGGQAPLREVLEDIKAAGERAASLTRQLLAFSRKQILQPEVLNLNHVVGETDRMLRRLIGEDIDLEIILSPDLGRIESDVGQLEQILMNLAVNARDAMPKGGKLTIETKNVELDEAYADTHIAVIPGSHAMLAVSDTGTGMTDEVQARIFEPFFTTKGKGKGTGLGLSTVYGIVKQSRGSIWVYSEPGKGATFKIYFPRVEAEVSGRKKMEAEKEGLCGTETVLVVEDDETVRNMAVKVLERYGYHVIAAGGGEDAIRVLQEHQGPIHLMLTDVIMPAMSGKDLAKRLSELQPDLKVLFMSGYTDNAVVHHGILEKGIVFLQKPFTVFGLAKKVREVLDGEKP